MIDEYIDQITNIESEVNQESFSKPMSSLIKNYDTLYTKIYTLNQQQVPSIEP